MNIFQKESAPKRLEIIDKGDTSVTLCECKENFEFNILFLIKEKEYCTNITGLVEKRQLIIF